VGFTKRVHLSLGDKRLSIKKRVSNYWN